MMTWTGLIAFFATITVIVLLRPLAIRLKLVDVPGGRKDHIGSVPLIGGLAMLLGLGFSSLFLPISLSDYRSLMAGMLVLVFVGVLDDFHELSARSRLIAEILAGVLMTVWGGVILFHFGDLLGMGDIYFSQPLASLITIFAAVGIMNASNMMDGLDGLAGSIAVTQLICLSLLAYQAGDVTNLFLFINCLGVLFGFLVFNFPLFRSAKVFMGDAGSLLLGFILVWFLTKVSQGSHPLLSPVTGLWIMAVPLYETGCAIIRRVKHKRSPLSPDSDHVHHILKRLGLHPLWIVLIMSGFSLMMGLIGITLHTMPDNWMFGLFVVIAFLYLSLMTILNHASKMMSYAQETRS